MRKRARVVSGRVTLRPRHLLPLIGLLLGLSTAHPALAQPSQLPVFHDLPPASLANPATAACISPGEAVRIAQQRYGGKAVKVERGDGVYYVRLLLPNGRVKLVVVDAQSGSVGD